MKRSGSCAEIYGPGQSEEVEDGRFLERSPGLGWEPRLIVMRYDPPRAPKAA